MDNKFNWGDSITVYSSKGDKFQSVLLMTPYINDESIYGSVLTPDGACDAMYFDGKWQCEPLPYFDENRFNKSMTNNGLSDRSDYNNGWSEFDINNLPEDETKKLIALITLGIQSDFEFAKKAASYISLYELSNIDRLELDGLQALYGKLDKTLSEEEDQTVEVEIELKEESEDVVDNLIEGESEYDIVSIELPLDQHIKEQDLIQIELDLSEYDVEISRRPYKSTPLDNREVYGILTNTEGSLIIKDYFDKVGIYEYHIFKWDDDTVEESKKLVETYIFKTIVDKDEDEQEELIKFLSAYELITDVKFITDSKISITITTDDTDEGVDSSYNIWKVLKQNGFFMFKQKDRKILEESKDFNLTTQLTDLETFIDEMDTANLVKIATGDYDVKKLAAETLEKRGLSLRKLKQAI